MTDEEQFRQASAEAERRKSAFLSSVAAAKARLSPARLKQDAKHKMSDGLYNSGSRAMATVSEHPVATGAAAGAVVLYLFRRPAWALFHRLYVRITNRTPDRSEKDHG